MSRELYQLEGQQLRLVLQLVWEGSNQRAAEILEQILTDGPSARGEED